MIREELGIQRKSAVAGGIQVVGGEVVVGGHYVATLKSHLIQSSEQ